MPCPFSAGIHKSNSRPNILPQGIQYHENQLRALFTHNLNSEYFQLERESFGGVGKASWRINK